MTHHLSTPGSDDGSWGRVLNDFINQAHNDAGSIKLTALTADGGFIKLVAGVPGRDLASYLPGTLLSPAAQTCLGLADSSVQSVNHIVVVSGNLTSATTDIGALMQSNANSHYLALTAAMLPAAVRSASDGTNW